MSTITETGHAKNVGNFEKLIANVTILGDPYNPSRPSLKLPELNTLLIAAKTAIQAVNASEAVFKSAVSARKVAFAQFGKLITRVNNALKASGTNARVNESAGSLVRKLQGRRATPKMTDEEKQTAAETGNTVTEISSSQMSFDNRIDNFDKLIMLLTSIEAYAPNEEDLTIAALTNLHNDLKAKNTAVIAAQIPLANARIVRNNVLYKENTGMVDISIAVKTYIKSVFGARSPQYNMISSLRFTMHK